MPQDFERRYKVFALGVPSDRSQPWERHIWRQIEDELAFLNDVCRGPIALRGRYVERQKNGRDKERGYGRLSWQRMSSDKWTSAPPGEEGPKHFRRFAFIEAFGPHKKRCFSGQGVPDFYMSLKNTFPEDQYKDHVWRAEFVLAIALDLPHAAIELFTASVHFIATLLGCSHMGQRQTAWGKTVGSFALEAQTFENLIQFCSPYMTSDPRNYQRPAHEMLKPEWQLVQIAV